MTDRDIFLELTLQLAQDGREPSAEDKSRNLAALRGRLGLPAVGDPSAGRPGAGGSSEVQGAHAPAPGGHAVDESPVALARRAFGARKSSRGWWRLVGASTVTGIAGFVLGLFVAPAVFSSQPLGQEVAGSPVAAPARQVIVPATGEARGVPSEQNADDVVADRVVAARASREVPGAGELPSVEASPNAGDAASGGPSASGGEAASSDVLRARDDAAPARRATRAVSPRARATSKAALASDAPDFLEAVRWLRRAQRAVRRGEGALALGLLDELDGRFPSEVLGEERQATRVLGLCGTGEDERARELARALLAQSPRSIYAERLRASCAASAIGGEATKNDLEGRE